MKKLNALLVTTLFATTLASCSSNATVASTSNTSSKETVCDENELLLTSVHSSLAETDGISEADETYTYEYDEDGKVISYKVEKVYSKDDTEECTVNISYLDDRYHYEYTDGEYYQECDYDLELNVTRRYQEHDGEIYEAKYSYTYNEDGQATEMIVEDDYKLEYFYDEDGYIDHYDEYSYDDGGYTYVTTVEYEYNDKHTKLTVDYDGLICTYYFMKGKTKVQYPLTGINLDGILLREVEEYYDEDDDGILTWTYVTDYTYEGCGKTYQYEE